MNKNLFKYTINQQIQNYSNLISISRKSDQFSDEESRLNTINNYQSKIDALKYALAVFETSLNAYENFNKECE